MYICQDSEHKIKNVLKLMFRPKYSVVFGMSVKLAGEQRENI